MLQAHLDAIKTGRAPLSYRISSWKDLQKWFLSQVELQKNFHMTRGCPFGTIGNEVTANDELIRQDLSLIFEVMKSSLAAFFIQEKSRGRLARSADPERMADFCIATIQGGMLLGKIRRDARSAETVVREALAHLKAYGARSKN